MRARSLGIIFVAAVIVPSILLAVLSIRAAGREEAFVEKQLATTLLAEVTHVADLAAAEVARVADELRAGLEVPAGGAYARTLAEWKRGQPLVEVPFLLSPRLGVLSPQSSTALGAEERRFIEENGDFLSNRAPTSVFENIAVKYKDQILAEPAQLALAPLQTKETERAEAEQKKSDDRAAIDAFAQSEAIQEKVYEQAREKGDMLSSRVAQPRAKASNVGEADIRDDRAAAAETVAAPAAGALAAQNAPAGQGAAMGQSATTGQSAAAAQTAPVTPSKSSEQQSQFVVTSQLLSQIAAQGQYGIIPRFIDSRLTFLFWEKQPDGRIAGCGISARVFRDRIAAVLPSTYTPARLLTILDETGVPLVAPPGSEGRNWGSPFVSREVGESLPRWEVAAALTSPEAVAARARASSLVLWVLIVILFVSVAGGGTMVLSSVYAEIRLAQKKATFVTNVSHELKTPLTSISLFVEMLRQKRQTDPAKQEQYFSLMSSETERLTRLINNVLSFSSLEKGKKAYAKKIVDLGSVVRETVESQRVGLESRGFSLSLRAPEGTLVEADPEALKQVLLNLLSNAEKYSGAVKEIEVEVAREPGAVVAHVRDRGIGVAEKNRQRIFREFYRVDDSLTARVQGTGLGLTIARRIARDHGGELAHRPRDGGGSDFSLSLPEAVQ
ncbi:MAG: HAMP domain-containing histidine kinase [Spirochaetes bacterium]|nr:HAMP domain-containing histidine kinase [Spirochaetota bacterium]